MTFYISDLKEKGFLNLLDSEFNPLSKSYQSNYQSCFNW